IEAAYENGLEIPHFCWHPDLSVAGNCRMCLVEVGNPSRDREGNLERDDNGNPVIRFIPKLQIACATPVSDGMVVKSKSEKAVESQEAVMEFLLINHPLDCPICDEAGECKLQEYAFNHSKGESRFDEMKNHKPKRQVWGPNVIFDAERCISCSRCIRYSQEVAKQDVLSFVQRGDHVTIELFDGTVWDNPYSMNVIEICPVGALTSPDFRFKSRVWEMSFNPSISFADATGSNTYLGVKNNEILRVQPRSNMHVNKHWLSDDARLNHIDFVNKNRVTNPMIASNGIFESVSWDTAHKTVKEKLSRFIPESIFVLGSAYATTESNFALKKFANDVLKTKNVDFLAHNDKSFEDDFLGVADRTPNSMGAKTIGINSNKGISASELIEKIQSGRIQALIVMEENFNGYKEILKSLDKLELLISLSYNLDDAARKSDIILPASTFAESEGTYINKDNRVQHLEPALITKENLRTMGMKLSRWDNFGETNDRWTNQELRICRQSWRIFQNLAKEFGQEWNWINSKDVFKEITDNHDDFKGMDYKLLDEYQGLTLGKADNPDNKVPTYVSHKMKPQNLKHQFQFTKAN
ncbi:molybdopterin-dependent oxidoreductase, partial [Candidatus Kapabacteria bacterium]|nr:molybdopterin-dependent oxidoreductase [Candidatus Kapabacteria bacterium]